jgi:hypothetical protein
MRWKPLDLASDAETEKPGLPDYSWYNKPKLGKIQHTNDPKTYQIAIKKKWTQSIPNYHKRCQNCPFQDLPKYTRVGFFGIKIIQSGNPERKASERNSSNLSHIG